MAITLQDVYLPIANVDRTIRKALPPNVKLSKDAAISVQHCVSEFISFITSQAAERCLIDKRKTLNGEDIIFALHALGFEHYAEVLRIYLAKYRIQESIQLNNNSSNDETSPDLNQSSSTTQNWKEEFLDDEDIWD